MLSVWGSPLRTENLSRYLMPGVERGLERKKPILRAVLDCTSPIFAAAVMGTKAGTVS